MHVQATAHTPRMALLKLLLHQNDLNTRHQSAAAPGVALRRPTAAKNIAQSTQSALQHEHLTQPSLHPMSPTPPTSNPHHKYTHQAHASHRGHASTQVGCRLVCFHLAMTTSRCGVPRTTSPADTHSNETHRSNGVMPPDADPTTGSTPSSITPWCRPASALAGLCHPSTEPSALSRLVTSPVPCLPSSSHSLCPPSESQSRPTHPLNPTHP